MHLKKNLFLSLLVALIFLIDGILTNSHYGLSWDEPEHFLRGQGYLRLFLTGKATYEGLPPYQLDKARSDPNYHSRSYYQHDAYGAQTWFVDDKGHPPLNDILSALFNYIFYQKLGIAGDIASYHLFNIFISSLLVGLVFLFAIETFGLGPGIFSAIFMGSYPLFWSESHFNIKDPAQSFFFVLTLYLLWKIFNKQKIKYILFAAIAAGLAFSVKFNILFSPFIVTPWALLLLIKEKKKFVSFLFQKNVLLILLIFPLIMLTILIAIWPFLWQDIFGNLVLVFSYYKELGTESSFDFNPLTAWNFYAARWILYTTPPLILICFLAGLINWRNNWYKNNYVFVLWFLIFIVTVGRVSFPNTSIYGGVRQIMEYIPAMALISGVGADWLRHHFIKFLPRYSILINCLFVASLLLISIYPLYKIHPNENVYFNFLVGGLKGAYQAGIPSAGNSYGNAYWQVIQWLNKHAEQNSRIALIQGTSLNIATSELRTDLDFSNSYWTGINREGEYLIELTPAKILKLFPYAWDYVDTLLEPVYEVKVDDMAIARVWKNDLEHTKLEYRKPEVLYKGLISQKIIDSEIIFKLEKPVLLTRLTLGYIGIGCQGNNGDIWTSVDGIKFSQEIEPIPTEQVSELTKKDNTIYYYFSARPAKYIKIIAKDAQSCLLHDPAIELSILKD